MNKITEYWDSRYKRDFEKSGGKKLLGNDDTWIEDHKAVLAKFKGGKALDLGSGYGQMSKYFSNLGYAITAVDISEHSLKILQNNIPNVRTIQHDISHKLPFADSEFDLVIANLSLHYFTEHDTKSAIAEIKRVLKSGGMLVGSVVSLAEHQHAVASGYSFELLEPNFYREDGVKLIRFFSHECIERFFSGFEKIVLDDMARKRMGVTKHAWEFIFVNVPAGARH